jgi:hypothetical protein
MSYNNITKKPFAFLNSLSKIEELTNYEITKLDPNWYKAMKDEFHTLQKKSNLRNMLSTKN